MFIGTRFGFALNFCLSVNKNWFLGACPGLSNLLFKSFPVVQFGGA